MEYDTRFLTPVSKLGRHITLNLEKWLHFTNNICRTAETQQQCFPELINQYDQKTLFFISDEMIPNKCSFASIWSFSSSLHYEQSTLW